MNYKVEYNCSEKSNLQVYLDQLYHYKNNIILKVQHRGRLNLFYNLMMKSISDGRIKNFKRALDIGSNAGYYSKMLSDFGFESVTGIDITLSDIQKSKERFFIDSGDRKVDFFVDNAETFSSDQLYDFILCTEVIEHTTHPNKVVENIKRLLAPGGIAIITMPNRISWPYFIEYFAYKVKRKPFNKDLIDHLSFPFYRSIRMFSDEGMEVIMTSGYNAFLDSISIKLFYRTGTLGFFNRINSVLSRHFPFKYFSQFFVVMVTNKSK